MDLSPIEVRVLGCLMEKQVTTPDQYPLTPNSVRLACNQTTNRSPIVTYAEHEVVATLASLRERGLTRIVYSPSNRAAKHRHIADEAWKLDEAEAAVMTVLALRGAQTAGEIKQRTDRLHSFTSLEDVERCLTALAAREEPFAIRLARRPGQKEERYHHLLAGPIDEEAIEAEFAMAAATAASSQSSGGGTAARVEALEARVDELESVVDQLRSLLD
jgi:uncharacterized protein